MSVKIDLFDVIQSLMASHSVSVHKYAYGDDIEYLISDLRKSIYPDINWSKSVLNISASIAKDVLYIFKDIFGVYYAVFVPSADSGCAIAVGPYLPSGESFNQDMYVSKGFSKEEADVIQKYLLKIPRLHAEAAERQLAAVLAVAVPDGKPDIKYIKEHAVKNKKSNSFSVVLSFETDDVGSSKVEQRYNIEDEILSAVAAGNYQKASEAVKKISNREFVNRYTPTMQTLHKSLVIMNTLYRKTISQAKVHPYYVDEISYRYFQKIDLISDRRDVVKLIDEMTKEYCSYVRNYSAEQYSSVVQKAFSFINANLSSQLKMTDIANAADVSVGYLSKVFQQQTGKTLLEYINVTRINMAAAKLRQSDKSMAEIAESVGIPDANYFSRLFKKYMGCSPTQYRKQQ